jgi:uncharacterized protein YjiS (DUF1127 family)
MSPYDFRSHGVASSIIPESDSVQTSFWNWPSHLAQRLMRGVGAGRRRARAKGAVHGMSDHLLKDIGLSPREIWLIRENLSSRL